MARRASPRPSPRRSPSSRLRSRSPRARLWRRIALISVLALATLAVVAFVSTRPSLRDRAEAAERSSDWPRALIAYRDLLRASPAPRARDRLGEARALLGLNLARQAESALSVASHLDPAAAEPWHLRLELLRVERRSLEALAVAEQAIAAIDDSKGRREILRDLTLALLFLDSSIDDASEDRARAMLARWVAADPEDDEARASLALRRVADPRPGDPTREALVSELSERLTRHPDRSALREALILALADDGHVDAARERLDAWPFPLQDARYQRLRGRWGLEYDGKAAEAAAAFTKTLEPFPHDWRSHYGLARALQKLDRKAESATEAETVAKLRERLERTRLTPRVARDLADLESPEAIQDLADLCAGVGLKGLAQAWAKEAAQLY